MRERLDADIGYAGLVTKNPRHARWRVLRGPVLAYELGELAEWLPGLDKFIPKRLGQRPAEQVGLGRNVTLFDRLREWAYRAIRTYWGGGIDGWNSWIAACNGKALSYNGDFPIPLQPVEVWHIAKSVAKWTWRNTTQQGFGAWQAAVGRRGGVASGKVRRCQAEETRARALELMSGGLTQAAAARVLGIHKNTISRWSRHGRDSVGGDRWL